MKKASIFLIVVILVTGMVGCGPSVADDIEIQTWYDLDTVRDNLDGSYILTNNLDSTTAGYTELASSTANGGKGWQPIGASYNPFSGILDGQGYAIHDLYINRPNENYVGLFGYAGGGGTIKDTGATNIDVIGYRYVGGLVGCNDGEVNDSYSIGKVIGEEDVGGMVGYDSGHNVSNS